MAQEANIVGKVIVVEGEVLAKGRDGQQRALKVGDSVFEGDVLVTAAGARVELEFAADRTYLVPEKETVTLDESVFATAPADPRNAALLGRGEDLAEIARAIVEGTASLDDLLEEPAAGFGGGGQQEGHTFVQLLRVLESVGSVEYRFGSNESDNNPVLPAGTAEFTQQRTQAGADITIDAIAGDDIVNAAEAKQIIAITGSAGIAGDTVTVTVGGNVYTGTVDADGRFSIDVPGSVLAGSSIVNASVSTTDSVGNRVSSSVDRGYSVDTTAEATITVAPITADNILNAAEAAGGVNIGGSVGGDAKPGDTVTVTVNGVAYTGVVAADLSYSIAVPGAELAADADKRIEASVSASDAAGNQASATAAHSYSVDTSATASISIGPITPDNLLSATEFGSSVDVTGSVGGDAKPGDTVTVTVNGVTYNGLVAADLSFNVAVPGAALLADPDHSVEASITATDAAGNSFTTSAVKAYNVASAGIVIDPVTADNIVNASESSGDVTITGRVSGDAKPGDTVTVSVNGVQYTGLVEAGNTFSIAVAGADLAVDADHRVSVSVAATDAEGIAIIGMATHAYSVDTVAPAGISIDPVTADNVLNAAEAGGSVTITGSVTGEVKAGDTVTVTVNNVDYTGTVGAGLTYSIAVPGAGLLADGDQRIEARVSGSDAAGNPYAASNTHEYAVDARTVAAVVGDSQAEGTANTFTVTMSGISTTPTTVTLSLTSATASVGIDTGTTFRVSVDGGSTWTALAGNSTNVPTGTNTMLVKVDTVTDSIYEPTEVYTLTAVANSVGASGSANILNANHAPEAVADATTALEAGGTNNTTPGIDPTGNVLTNDTDIDVGDSKFVTVVQFGATPGTVGSGLAGAYGTLTLNADGSYSYAVNNANSAVQALRTSDDSLVDTFTYTMRDAAGATSTTTLKVTIHGANDAPISIADNYSLNEGTTGPLGSVMTNDSDVDAGTALHVLQFAMNSGSAPVTVNGVNSITTALGGTVVMNGNGTFTYSAPVRNHADALADRDSFVYRTTDGAAVSTWTTVSIDVADTSPLAHADLDSVGVGGAIAGNVVSGAGGAPGGADVLGMDAAALSSVTYQGTPVSSSYVGGVWTIKTTNGTLSIGQDGAYTYASDLKNVVAAGGSASGWAGVGYYGFDGSNPFKTGGSGSGLDLTKLTATAQTFVNFANTTGDVGMGVETPVTNNRIQSGEYLVLDVGMAAKMVSVTLSNLTSGRSANWYAYDVNGNAVGSGSITNSGASNNSFTAQLSTTGSARYVVFGYSATSGDDFRVAGLTAERDLTGISPDVFNYTLTDADGSSSSATLTVSTDSAVTATPDQASVYEAGLASGTQVGVLPVAATGNLLVNDAGIGANTSITSVAGQAPDVNGVVTLSDSVGSLTVYTKAYAGHQAGDYAYTLSGPTAQGLTDARAFSYTLADSVSGRTSSATLTINVVDDAPIVIGTEISNTLQAASGTATYNLVIILDRSGSMAWDANGNSAGQVGFDPNTVRIDIAKDALAQLIDRFDTLGNVNVQIVDFSSTVNESGWYIDDKYAAVEYVNALQPNGGTQYTTALNAVMAGFSKPVADKTLFYFISDGEPNAGYEVGPTLQSQWQSFVTSNGDISFGIGIGEVGLAALLPVAYPNVDADGNGQEDYAIKVANATDLADTLLATVDSGSVSGNVLARSSGDASGFLTGADGGHLQSVVVDGVTYTHVVGGPDTLTVATLKGGELTVNFATGAYEYHLTLNTTVQGQQEIFPITVIDGDGDAKTANLVINLDYVANLDANRDVILTNITDGSPLNIAAAALMHNDVTGGAAVISSVQNAIGGTVSGGSTVVFDPPAALQNPLEGTIVIANEVAGDDYSSQLNDTRATAVDLTDRSRFGTVVPSGQTLGIDVGGYTQVFRGTLNNGLSAWGGGGWGGGGSSTLPDIDYVKVRLNAGESLFIDVDKQTSNVAAQVEYQDSQGVWQTAAIATSGGNVNGAFAAPMDGDFYIRLQSTDASQDTGYELLLTIQQGTVAASSAGQFDYTLSEGGIDASATAAIYGVGGNTITGTAKDEILLAGDGNDTLFGNAGDDVLLGNGGSDSLVGGDGADRLEGGAGGDTLSGGEGRDVLFGGAGADLLGGGAGADVFAWKLADAGTPGSPVVDTISDFDTVSNSDKLDLRDLLQGEIAAGPAANLEHFLHFEKSGANTKVHVSSSGGFAGGFDAAAENQTIVLQNVDLVGSLTTDQQIIQDLLNKQKLITD